MQSINRSSSEKEFRQLKIALLQDKGSQNDDLNENLAAIASAAEAASQNDVELLLFPQCFLTGYFRPADIRATALSINDKILSGLEAIAREHNLAMVVGSYEYLDRNIYNASLFITPDNGHQATYRKRLLFRGWEQDHFKKGQELVVVSYKSWNIGLLIGFEVEFPEIVRQLARQNIDLLLVSASLIEPLDHIALHVVPTRAIENQIFLAFANRIGHEENNHYLGRSTIIGPDGGNLAAFGREERGILAVNLEKSLIHSVRSQYSYLDELDRM